MCCLAFACFFANFSLVLLTKVLLIKKVCVSQKKFTNHKELTTRCRNLMPRRNPMNFISVFFEVTNCCSILGEPFFLPVLLSCLPVVFLSPKLCFHNKNSYILLNVFRIKAVIQKSLNLSGLNILQNSVEST